MPDDLLPGKPPQGGIASDAAGLNLYRADGALGPLLDLWMDEGLRAHLEPHLETLGTLAGGRLDALAREADRNGPVLVHRDRFGNDIDAVEHHPAYRAMQEIGLGRFGLAAMSHREGVLGWPGKLPPIAKYAFQYLFAQAEFGLLCPISMTDSMARVLSRFDPALAETWVPALSSQDPDAWATGAMFMTEKQAGSDVGATATIATPLPDGTWSLTGDKWFCSNAGCDAALVLARARGVPGTAGLGLFLLPRTLPGGRRNRWRIVRLKDKLGTRSMASGEVVLDGAVAYPVGDVTRGFAQMLEMVNVSRLSNGVRAAGMMRRALIEASVAAAGRAAFGRRVADYPSARRQLLKIRLPAEQALSFTLFAADVMGRADAGDAEAAKVLRLATPLLKFRACRDARKVAGDAMEMRGGNGYIEDFVEARLVRDTHLGSIWEGTSNVVAEDAIARAVGRGGCLAPFVAALTERLAEVPLPVAGPVAEALNRAAAFAEEAASVGEGMLNRQASSGLYHAATAVLFAWEGARLAEMRGDARRLTLARLVLEHRLTARDPLARGDVAAETAIAEAWVEDSPLSLAEALALA
ncbi:acyl-CoA dehydrogenase family protein [Elioraea rosea]|uniref:acyl-CoA dehydrogenase family protein n=1 Tax=Elioraea rosea TaxID=2492390 RepID=UPI0011834A10|nr:acyl-CoA dehydrogenase family protein [Elioraea rosea]